MQILADYRRPFSWKFSIRREASVRFGSVTVRGWNGSSGSGFRFRLGSSAKRVFLCFQCSLTGKDSSGSGFGSWKTVPAVPVPLSVSGKTVPTVPVPGSGSVPEPPCIRGGQDPQKTADVAENRRFAQRTAENRRLGSVTLAVTFRSVTSSVALVRL